MRVLRTVGLCCVMAWSVGCATTHQTVDAPPLAEDLSWSRPAPVQPPAPEPTATATEPETARSPKEKVYHFTAGGCDAADVAVGSPTVLMFQPGEEIRDWADGDRSPMDSQNQAPLWEFKQSYVGEGKTGRPVMLITVPKAGLKNTFTATTTERIYCVDLKSVAKTARRFVRWTYTDEPVKVAKVPPRLWPDPAQPQRYHAGYAITATEPKPVWAPRQAVDDGYKTYLIFPPTVTTVDSPVIRLVGAQGPEMVNARQVGNVVILDRLTNQIELRLGAGKHAELVKVTRGTPQTIACPGSEECPVWPDAVVRAAP